MNQYDNSGLIFRDADKQTIIKQFKRLLAFARPISFLEDKEAFAFWVEYQKTNRAALEEIRPDDDALGARLSTAPDNVLKVAGLFETCRAVRAGETSVSRITLESLKLAAMYVEENLKAAAFLDRYGERKAIREQAEVVLAVIRNVFSPQRPDTIYVTSALSP